MSRTQRLIKKIFFISIVLFIIAYVYYQSINLVTGPEITIISPINGSVVTESLVIFSGNTKNIAHITFNDRPIFVNEKGEFSQALLVLPGLNIIEFTAGDRFGRTTQKTVQLIYRKAKATEGSSPDVSKETIREEVMKEIITEEPDGDINTKPDDDSSSDNVEI